MRPRSNPTGSRRVLGTGVSSAGSLPRKRAEASPRSVPCGDCGAVEGEFCVKAGGGVSGTYHVSRRRVAQREANKARGL